MKTELLGFRVSARPPPAEGKAPRVDNFELKQSAVECAARSLLAGWRDVRVYQVTRETSRDYDFVGDEELDQIWPEAEAA